MLRSSHRRRVRLLAPVAVAAAIGLGSWLPTLSAGAAPDLSPLTAQQLLVKVGQSKVPALSGTVRWTANLGLPSDLASLAGGGQGSTSSVGFDPVGLLSGTHTLEVWDNGSSQQRLALVDSPLSETDVIHNGSTVWLWDSSANKATRLIASGDAIGASAPGTGRMTHESRPAEAATSPALTPDQVATRLLTTLQPSTSVTAKSTQEVAGRSAYDLTLAPASGSAAASQSTIDHLTIAIDSDTGLPLRVQVFTKNSDPKKSPTMALEVGYSSISLGAPAASEFNFSPPAGAMVTTQTVGGGTADPSGTHPSGAHPASASRDQGGAPTVSGEPWAQIVTFHQSGLGTGGSRDVNELTTPVSGAFGSAQLLQTSAINALILPDGRVLAGFVTVATLEAAAVTGAG